MVHGWVLSLTWFVYLILDIISSGIPFNDTSNFRLAIAEKGQAILGKNLVGLQVGNEPDLYAKHFRRPAVCSTDFYSNR